MEYARRCKSKTNDETFKRLHGVSKNYTLCRRELNEMWFIESNVELTEDDITCPKCKKRLKMYKYK